MESERVPSRENAVRLLAGTGERRAWPQACIWTGWSEVSCGRTRPDALCWGRLDGYETLFWLEVESGNGSSKVLREKTIRRVNQALLYARGFSVRLVFAFLGPPWVCEEGMKVFRDLPNDVAVVVEDWKAFGELPVPEWGRVGWRLEKQIIEVGVIIRQRCQ